MTYNLIKILEYCDWPQIIHISDVYNQDYIGVLTLEYFEYQILPISKNQLDNSSIDELIVMLLDENLKKELIYYDPEDHKFYKKDE